MNRGIKFTHGWMNAYNHLRTHMRKYECLYAFLIACYIHVFSFDVVRRCEGIDITSDPIFTNQLCCYCYCIYKGL